MDNRRIPINVSITPSDYSGRSIRLGNSDIREKMNQRMREFEEESRKWRDQFMSSSGLPQTSLLEHRPRMLVNFPEFPELSSGFSSPLSSRLGPSSSFFPAPIAQTTHKSFIEEDDHGSKKYKMTFDIGDFKPHEIQVRTEGRQLIVKGDRELVAGSATESKQFNREITLPDFVEPTSVTSYLNDGVLTIDAPVLLDRLGYTSSNPAITNSTSSSSTLRQSPYRDNQSPSRVSSILNNSSQSSSASNAGISRNYRSSREDLLGGSLSHNSSTNTPYFHTDINPPPPLSFANTSSSSIVSNNAGNSQAQTYKFNMSEFRPEDIAITVTDTTLKIHAVREENDARGYGKTYREFKREIGLPQGADVKRLRNSLQSDGTLIIEIPVQDNSTFRPPLSPTGVTKQFSNFSLNDNNVATSNSLSSSAAVSNTNNNGGLIDTTNTGKELRLTFDLTGYKPEDLSIKVIDNNTLKVHAVHIDNSRGNQIHREYTRQYILPDWVQPELLRARMSDDGTLTVEVPMPQAQPSKLERFINIQNS